MSPSRSVSGCRCMRRACMRRLPASCWRPSCRRGRHLRQVPYWPRRRPHWRNLSMPRAKRRTLGIETRRVEQEPIWDWASRNLSAASDRLLSPADRFERAVAPWSTHVVLPLFAFSATGISLAVDLRGRRRSRSIGRHSGPCDRQTARRIARVLLAVKARVAWRPMACRFANSSAAPASAASAIRWRCSWPTRLSRKDRIRKSPRSACSRLRSGRGTGCGRSRHHPEGSRIDAGTRAA